MQSPHGKIAFEEDATDRMLPFTFDLPSSALIYVDNAKQFKFLEKLLNEAIAIGIDTETKPNFIPMARRKPNARFNPTSIIQMAVRTCSGCEQVVILDLLTLKQKREDMMVLDGILLATFENMKCCKLGHGLERDFCELFQAYPFMNSFATVNFILDTTAFYRHLNTTVTQDVSLKFLVKEFLNFNLVKTQQMSNWGQRPLTASQIHYAACDALVLLRLLDAMSCEAEESLGSETSNEENDDPYALIRKLTKNIRLKERLSANSGVGKNKNSSSDSLSTMATSASTNSQEPARKLFKVEQPVVKKERQHIYLDCDLEFANVYSEIGQKRKK